MHNVAQLSIKPFAGFKFSVINNLFERANKVPEAQIEAEAKQEMLLQEVGQLQIENRFLKKKYKQQS